MSGAATDVTARTASTALGASPDTDAYPLFDPKDNSFWFVRNGTDVMRVPEGSTQATKVGTVPAGDSFVISRTGNLVDIPSTTDSIGDTQIGISYGSPLSADSDGTEFSTFSNTGLELGPTGRGPWTPSPIAGLGSFEGGLTATWLNDTLLIAPLASGAVDLLTYTPNDSSLTAATLLTTTPSSPTFTISPDGKTLAFLASLAGGGLGLYEISLGEAGAQARFVGATTCNELIGWR